MTLKQGIRAMQLGLALLLCGCAGTHRAPRAVHLIGSLHGSSYTSAEGGFSLPVPVSTEVGGRVLTDGPHSVTFVDNWGSRVTLKEQPILDQSPMMTMLQQQGREKALSEVARREYGDLITVHYHPDVRDGLTSFIFLRPASPKTAVAIFIHAHRLFMVETDILPGVQLLAQSDEQSQKERDGWLEGVAIKLAQTIDAR